MTHLAAIGDTQHVIERLDINDDLMLLVGDKLFDFESIDYVSLYDQVVTNFIAIYSENNIEQLKCNGIAEIDKT